MVEDKETTELRHQEEETTINISSESSSNLVDGDIQKGDTLVDNEESAFQFLKESVNSNTLVLVRELFMSVLYKQ